MNKYLTPKGFLQLGGVILLALGIVGYVTQALFPPQGKFIGDVLDLDSFENIAHTVLGIIAIAAYTLSTDLQKWLVALVGALGIVEQQVNNSKSSKGSWPQCFYGVRLEKVRGYG